MRTESGLREWGIAILRLVVGIAFVMHGGQKLFVLGFAGSTGVMVRAGIPLPWLAGPFIALVEFCGGVALVLGLLSRWAALLLVCDMMVAILKVNIHKGFMGPGGVELPLILLAANLAVAACGSGALSLEAVFWRAESAREGAGRPTVGRLAGGGDPLQRSAG